jgi:triacylglycerol lipase
MSFTDQQAAQLASLGLYAWDMCDSEWGNTAPALDPRILADGWIVVGYLAGDDFIFEGPDTNEGGGSTLRNTPDEQVCYGFLAKNQGGDFVAVVRGTDKIQEWADDFAPSRTAPDAPLQGLVELGFYEVFKSMVYLGLGSGAPSVLADGVVAAVGSANLTVVGHSLGSALGIFLTAELVAAKNLGGVDACFFAVPKPGNRDFADYFDTLVKDYLVIDYTHDIAHDLPPGSAYENLPHRDVIDMVPGGPVIAPDLLCCHHLVSYIALLDMDEFNRVKAASLPMDRGDLACVNPAPPAAATSNEGS